MKKHFPGSNSYIKFRLLMWKNFLQQWRHRIQTVVEILLPVATMALVLILRQQIEPIKRDAVFYPPVPAYTLKYSAPVLGSFDYTNLSIAYSPESPVLGDVVQNAVINLFSRNIKEIIQIILERIPELPELPDIPIEIPPDINLNSTIIGEIVRRLVRIEAYNSSAALQSIYSDENDIRKVLAAVEFNDQLLGFDDSWDNPSNLSYALRFPEKPRLNSLFGTGGSSWRSDNVFPFFELPGPRFPKSWEGGNDPGYVNEMFIGLQHAISMELVSLITGQNLKNFTVNLNRYPHPPYLQDFAVEALIFMFPLFIMLSFSYTSVNIIRTVTVEKELQLKETMKIMGLPTWLHWLAWFCKQFIYLFLTAALIVLLLKVNWFSNEQGYSNYSVFTKTSWSVLLFFVVLYLTCTIFFCFMISSFFSKGTTAALFGGIIWFISYIPAFLLGMDVELSLPVQTLTCLSINSAMSYGFQLILRAESGQGMQWGDFFANHALDSNRLLFGHVCGMLVVNCVLYMLVALYFEQVLPGPFGTPQVWYFPFQKSFWFPSRQVINDYGLFDTPELDVTIKEKDPTNHQIGVKMENLTKVYGSNTVVNNISLNIYDGQITVLLGHNGAGKSTTISMLTGNVEITRGSVWVAGYDMTTQTLLARAHIGLCPQHNVLFNELTVREHLEFFARLKGYSGQQLDEDIDKLIDSLELQEKKHYNAEGLSGGQKRRLCVGIALCGGARVVLLDEPTSGMDPSSRRALWELLQREKKHRSMILTTHFMDEADFLGDRVAIMSSGKLQCVGSPYFLKQHYGVGYTMVIVKEEDFQLDFCTELIRKYIPDITVKQDRGKEVTYSLPNHFSHLFEEMLNDLERNSHIIQYKNYGLVATTLEDVFMSVGSDIEVHSESDDNTTISTDIEYMENESDGGSLEQLHKSDQSETGYKLIWLHVSGIWLKLFWISTRSLGFLLLQVLVPVVIINTSLGILQYLFANRPTVISRPLILSEGYLSTQTFVGSNGTDESAIGALAYKGYEVLFKTFNIDSMELTVLNNIPLDEYYLEKTDDPVMMAAMRNKLLIGATFGNNEAVAWFSNFGYHDVATSLAAVHSAILKGLNSTTILNVFNHPLKANYRDRTDLQVMVSLLSMQVASSIGNSLAIVSAAYIMFYIRERVSRAKLLQRAAGVRPAVMWFASVLYDWLWFLLLCQPIIISCAAFSVIGLSTGAELGRLFLCLMVYGAAMLPLHYLFSLLFSGPAIGFVVMFFVNVLFGLMGPQIVEALKTIATSAKLAATILDYILQFFPLYSLVTSTRLINQAGLKTFSCMELCSNVVGGIVLPNMTECTMDALCKNFPDACCVRDNIFEWQDPGILRYLVCSIGSCIVFWSILMILEYNVFGRLLMRFRKAPLKDAHTHAQDDDVAAEAEHAQQAATHRGLVARGLTKYYGNHLAVDQISFTVNEAEIFGLLGVNGAGKTTTFKMLMGDESISEGDAYVSGYSVRKNITKVHKNIGYCPQFDAVFGELTGRETIYLFSRFRGLKYASSSVRAEIIANALGFTKHLDKRVEQYSGGTKRKLSTGVSLLGGTRLVFVDEPTTGVDPAAKRTVWSALRAARRAGRAFVLTSHSMEECEALCDRLTVMVNGRFRCLGSPQHLKNKFSEGFTLTIKIRTYEDSARSSDKNDGGINTVKRYVNANFKNVKLMEEYQGILTYYLPDRSVPWSNMFGIMERAKSDLDVEDYSILQTTLEQIFLQFTKYQQDSSNL